MTAVDHLPILLALGAMVAILLALLRHNRLRRGRVAARARGTEGPDRLKAPERQRDPGAERRSADQDALAAMPAEGAPQDAVEKLVHSADWAVADRTRAVDSLRRRLEAQPGHLPYLQAILAIMTAPGFAADKGQPRLIEAAATTLLQSRSPRLLGLVAERGGEALFAVPAAITRPILAMQLKGAVRRARAAGAPAEVVGRLSDLSRRMKTTRMERLPDRLADLVEEIDDNAPGGDWEPGQVAVLVGPLDGLLQGITRPVVDHLLALCDDRSDDPFWRLARLEILGFLVKREAPLDTEEAERIVFAAFQDPDPRVAQQAIFAALDLLDQWEGEVDTETLHSHVQAYRARGLPEPAELEELLHYTRSRAE